MAMLADVRRKQKFSADPRNLAWSKDENKFGHKLMEKMGWSQGKGLGAKEDGNVDHVAVNVKNDTRGVGCSKSYVDNWIAHQDDFNALLANLGKDHTGEEGASDNKVTSLEQTSKSSKGRLHYMKFTKGKDLSLKSESDLDCVFGKRKSQSGTNTPQTQSEPNSDNESGGSSDAAHGIPLVTSTDSVQEYFKKKMAEKMAKLKGSSLLSPDYIKKEKHDSNTDDNKSDEFENNRVSNTNFENVDMTEIKTKVKDEAMEDKEGCDSDKISKKPKKKKRRKELEEYTDNSEVVNKNDGNSENDSDKNEHKKKSKKKKKSKEVDESENSVSLETKTTDDIEVDSEVKTDIKKKSKKKRKKEVEEVTDDINEAETVDSNVDKSDNVEVISKKKNKKKKHKEVEVDEGDNVDTNTEVNDNTVCEIKSKKKNKKRKRKADDDNDDGGGEVKVVTKKKKTVRFSLGNPDDDVKDDDNDAKMVENCSDEKTSVEENDCDIPNIDSDSKNPQDSSLKTPVVCPSQVESQKITDESVTTVNQSLDAKVTSQKADVLPVVKEHISAFKGASIHKVNGYVGMPVTAYDIKAAIARKEQKALERSEGRGGSHRGGRGGFRGRGGLRGRGGYMGK